MRDFTSSHLGQLRKIVGNCLLLVPGARIIILDSRQRILLQRRRDFKVWGLPGGNAEEGEDLMSVITREVAEETGLRLLDAQPFGFGSTPELETFTFPNGDRTQHFVLNFYCHRFKGIAKVSDDESTEIKWFSSSELPEMVPNMRESIRAYKRFLSSKQFQLF